MSPRRITGQFRVWRRGGSWKIDVYVARERIVLSPDLGSKYATTVLSRKLWEALQYKSVSEPLPRTLHAWFCGLPEHTRRMLAERGFIENASTVAEILNEHRETLRGTSASHCHTEMQRVYAVYNEWSKKLFDSLTTDAVAKKLRRLSKERSWTSTTMNYYVAAVKRVAKFGFNARLQTLEAPKIQRRREARHLTADELTQLLRGMRGTRGGMTVEERRALYAFAAGTGLRANELRSLTWDCLTEDSVVLSGDHTKNDDVAWIPVPYSLIKVLPRRHGEDKVFAMPPKQKLALIIRADAKQARVPWTTPTSRRLNFHSLRQCLVS